MAARLIGSLFRRLTLSPLGGLISLTLYSITTLPLYRQLVRPPSFGANIHFYSSGSSAASQVDKVERAAPFRFLRLFLPKSFLPSDAFQFLLFLCRDFSPSEPTYFLPRPFSLPFCRFASSFLRKSESRLPVHCSSVWIRIKCS